MREACISKVSRGIFPAHLFLRALCRDEGSWSGVIILLLSMAGLLNCGESKAYFGSPFSVKAGLFLHPLCMCDATLESSKLLYII